MCVGGGMQEAEYAVGPGSWHMAPSPAPQGGKVALESGSFPAVTNSLWPQALNLSGPPLCHLRWNLVMIKLHLVHPAE